MLSSKPLGALTLSPSSILGRRITLRIEQFSRSAKWQGVAHKVAQLKCVAQRLGIFVGEGSTPSLLRQERYGKPSAYKLHLIAIADRDDITLNVAEKIAAQFMSCTKAVEIYACTIYHCDIFGELIRKQAT